MTEKTEWEIVDVAVPEAHDGGQQSAQQEQYGEQRREQFHAQYGVPPNMQQSMKTLLGPWWRWKLAGAAVALTVVLVLVATLAGAMLLVVTVAAMASFGIAKLRQWLRRANTSF